MQRDFKGVWIPKEIWLDEEISWMEKLFLTEIDSLVKNGECFATNEYFAKFFKLSKDRASRIINTLAKKKYIEIKLVYKEGTKQIQKRTITTAGHKVKLVEQMLGKPIGEIIDTPIGENNDTPIGESNDTPIGENADTPIGENNEDNNTLINNTNINNTNIKDNVLFQKKNSSSSKKESKKKSLLTTEEFEICKQVIDYLNEKASKKFRATTEATQRFIKKRLEEDYTIADFKRVVDVKTSEWLNTEWERYLQPSTLFNDQNFEKYLNQPLKKSTKRVNDPNDYGAEYFDNLEKQKQQNQTDAEAEFLGW